MLTRFEALRTEIAGFGRSVINCQSLFGESSNGRTPDSGSGSWGSNPCSPAIFQQPHQSKRYNVRSIDAASLIAGYVRYPRGARSNGPMLPCGPIKTSQRRECRLPVGPPSDEPGTRPAPTNVAATPALAAALAIANDLPNHFLWRIACEDRATTSGLWLT